MATFRPVLRFPASKVQKTHGDKLQRIVQLSPSDAVALERMADLVLARLERTQPKAQKHRKLA